jgi:cholesterol transport system auxiliary component
MLCLPVLSGGCGGLFGKAPERSLYRLNPNVELTQTPPRVAALLVLATPTAAAGLDTTRIALIRSPVAIDYYADGEWIDRPPFLVKQALIEGFQKSDVFGGVASEGLGLNANYVLNTNIRDFTAIYDAPDNPPLARVRIAAELITMPDRNIAAATSITREARAGAVDLPSIVQAFDRALGDAVQAVIVWAATNPAVARKSK